MKKRKTVFLGLFLALLSFLILAQSASGEDIQELFDKANGAYESGEHERALELYKGIALEGFYSGQLFYNMGNAYYRLGMPERAHLSYRRAALFIPRDPDLRANSTFLSKQTDVTEGQRGFYRTPFVGELAEYLTFSEMAWAVSALFAVLGIMILVLPLFRRAGYFERIITFGLLAAFLFSGYAAYRKYEVYENMVLMGENSAEVRYAPLTASTRFFTLPPGEPALVLREDKGWVRLRDVEGRIGWAEKNKVMFLKLENIGR